MLTPIRKTALTRGRYAYHYKNNSDIDTKEKEAVLWALPVQCGISCQIVGIGSPQKGGFMQQLLGSRGQVH